jgi:hypothetical protein
VPSPLIRANIVRRLHRKGNCPDGEIAFVDRERLRRPRYKTLGCLNARRPKGEIVIESANVPSEVAKFENAFYDLTNRRNLLRLPRPIMLSEVPLYWASRYRHPH